MSGLCGWIGASKGLRADEVALAMEAGMFLAPDLHRSSWIHEDAAVMVATRRTTAIHRDAHGTVVAIDGSPRWTHQGWQEIAECTDFAESICQAYQARGEGFLSELMGPFAVAVIDIRSGRLLLAIDRVGKHSLAYSRTPHGLVFGTSLDAVRTHPDVQVSVQPQAIYRYLLNEVSPGPCTIYDKCYKLLPAHKLIYRRDEIKIERYWRIPYDRPSVKPFSELKEELFSHLTTAVRRAMSQARAGDALGAFLSGGLDSSAVCGFMQKECNSPVSAFTVSFEDEQYDESIYARAVSEKFGLSHCEYRLKSNDVTDLIFTIPAMFDEPFANSSVIPSYYCAKMARDAGVDLILAGDGGDETFAGNKRYVEQKVLSFYDAIPLYIRQVLDFFVLGFPDKICPPLLAKCKRYISRAKISMPERMHNPEIFNRQQLASVFTDEAMASIDVEEPYELWRRHYDESGTEDLIYSMMYSDTRTTLADNDLRKVGRACDLAGVEVAFPMLDEDLIEYAAKIPSNLLIKGLELRYFFRKAMEGFLPRETLEKKKHGFGMPFWQWARKDAQIVEIVDSCFDSLKSRRVFRKAFLDQVLREHREKEQTKFHRIIFDLVMLELWQRKREKG